MTGAMSTQTETAAAAVRADVGLLARIAGGERVLERRDVHNAAEGRAGD
jgi:hypothetical protein